MSAYAWKKALKSLAGAPLRRRAELRMDRLVLHPAEPVRKLARAVRRALRADLGPDEGVRVDAIEEVRERLERDTTAIDLPGVGAGDPILESTTMSVGDVCRRASKERFWALVLFEIVREFKPRRCLELGTCLGISAAYQCAALELNGGGRLISLEGSGTRAAVAREALISCGASCCDIRVGRFADTLPDVLDPALPLDYVFVDGHHDERATMDYYSRIRPCLAPGAVVVFDDVAWSAGMHRAWSAIRAGAEIRFALYLRQLGICLLDAAIEARSSVDVSMI